MNITIRLATPYDAPKMAEIHMKSWEIAYKDIIPIDFINEKNSTRHSLYKRVITEENMNSYIILDGDKEVGIFKIADPQDNDLGDDFYELHYIYLHPDYFRLGIGTKVMEFVCDKVRCLNKKAISCWVLADNVNSIQFYDKCGFIPDGASKINSYGKDIYCIRMIKYL